MKRKTSILNNLVISMISLCFSLGILGVLIATALNSYKHIPGQVSVTRIFSNVDPIISEIYTYYALNDRWPNINSDLPMLQSDEFNKYDGEQYRLEKGSIHVTMSSNHRDLNGKVISFRKAEFSEQTGGSTLWLCGYQPIPAGMVVDVKNQTNVTKKYLITRCK